MVVNVHLFTYGSLMFPEVWSTVVKGEYERMAARLYSYKRLCVKGEAYPAAVAATVADYIDGQLYLNVGDDDLLRLDRFEGNDYEKVEAPLILAEGGVVMAQLYICRYPERLEEREWDVEWFAREGIKDFMAQYGGFSRA